MLSPPSLDGGFFCVVKGRTVLLGFKENKYPAEGKIIQKHFLDIRPIFISSNAQTLPKPQASVAEYVNYHRLASVAFTLREFQTVSLFGHTKYKKNLRLLLWLFLSGTGLRLCFPLVIQRAPLNCRALIAKINIPQLRWRFSQHTRTPGLYPGGLV